MTASAFARLYRILIVDDSPDSLGALVKMLSPCYQVSIVGDGVHALQVVFSDNPPDLILLDIMMPAPDGYQVCQQIRANADRRQIPIIFVTAMAGVDEQKLGLELGAVDYLVKPVNPVLALARIKTHLALYDQRRKLARLVEERDAELTRTRYQLIGRLARAAQYREVETGNHVIRVSHYARLIGQALGLDQAATDRLFHAAQLHDVGKIGVPDHILLKRGALDPAEQAIFNEHTTFGADIIGRQSNPLLLAARDIALSHHERWDGSGYPHALKGNAIPLMARIVALADAFDDLTSARTPYQALALADAVRRIEAAVGSHFDPGLLAAFHQALPQLRQIMRDYGDGYGIFVIDSDVD